MSQCYYDLKNNVPNCIFLYYFELSFHILTGLDLFCFQEGKRSLTADTYKRLKKNKHY